MKGIKTEKKRYTMRPSVIDGYFAFWTILHGLFFIAIFLFGYSRMHSYLYFIIFLAALSFKIYIYQMIDIMFAKHVISTQKGEVYIKFIFRWKVDLDKCYLIIEDLFVPTTTNIKHTSLLIYRNNPQFFNRLFKNKIKLHILDDINVEQGKMEAKQISKLFGIKFRDIYDG